MTPPDRPAREAAAEARLADALLDALPEAALVADQDGRVRRVNARAVALTAPGHRLARLLGPDAWPAAAREAAARADDAPPFTFAAALTAPEGEQADAEQADAAEATLWRVAVRRLPGDDDAADLYLVQLAPLRPDESAGAPRHHLLEAVTQAMRDPVASIRAAAETMAAYPEMEASVGAHFQQIIRAQAVALSDLLNAAVADYARLHRTQGDLVRVSGADALALVRRRLADAPDVRVARAPAAPDDSGPNDGSPSRSAPAYVCLDPYTLPEGVAFLAGRLVHATRCHALHLALTSATAASPEHGGGVALEMAWTDGARVSPERLATWAHETFPLGATVVTASLHEILDRHHAHLALIPEIGREGPKKQAVRLSLPISSRVC